MKETRGNSKQTLFSQSLKNRKDSGDTRRPTRLRSTKAVVSWQKALPRLKERAAGSEMGPVNVESLSAFQILTSWLLQIDKSATLPQFTETTSKQRSGSQPYTLKESWQPAYKQQPSGLNSTHLRE